LFQYNNIKSFTVAFVACFGLIFGTGLVSGAEDSVPGSHIMDRVPQEVFEMTEVKTSIDTIDRIDKIPSNLKKASGNNDLLLDHAVKAAWGSVAATLAVWRQKHFVSYLFGVSALAGFGLGIIAALLGHYGADPRAKWQDVRKKATFLAGACGLGGSVLLVGVILYIPSHGRLTYLVFSAVICALGAAVACSVLFVIVRRIRERRAKMAGLLFNQDRMRGF
jgi:hypothetical protein